MTELKGTIYGPDFQFHPGRLVMENGLIRELDLSDETVRTGFHEDRIGTPEADRHAPYILPGLIDIHFHGCMGMDFCDGTPEAIETIARNEAARGVTAICPATLTLPVDELKVTLRSLPGRNVRVHRLDGETDEFSAAFEGDTCTVTLKNVPVYSVIEVR